MGHHWEQCSREKCAQVFHRHSISSPGPGNRAHNGWVLRTYSMSQHVEHRRILHGIRLGSLREVLQRHVQHREQGRPGWCNCAVYVSQARVKGNVNLRSPQDVRAGHRCSIVRWSHHSSAVWDSQPEHGPSPGSGSTALLVNHQPCNFVSQSQYLSLSVVRG
jgi:hypothetical protein